MIMDAIIAGIVIITAIVVTTIISLNIVKKRSESLSANSIRILDNDLGWRDSSQPWNNCLDANKVYCSGSYTRQPGGCIKMRYYPRCGFPCSSSNECPEACSKCEHNRCGS